ncbi:hypothetical protein [Methylocystis sp. SB2]|uniref:hypothetical protein n=1 Tax=Methylocystis sp. (strain SB2) TaxID=743836 RepID=UPI000401EC64|nr:hypothetical protein [Methylocystis sp. SB2]ULO22697.1 hypothetical protein LNB28_10935 [Methylocystis sp. SB2]
MTKILGLGHSHIVAIAKGCYELQHEGFRLGGAPLLSRFLYLYDPEITPTLAEEGSASRLNARLRQIIDEERPDGVVLSVGGNEHIALSVTQPKERFDFILGAEPELDLEQGAEVLPEAAIRETLREKMAPTLSTIEAIRNETAAPIVCLEPPPPFPNSRILECPQEFFRKSFDPKKLSGEMFRYKMWRTQSALYREVCARADILFATVPTEFIAPSGVLAKVVWGADASHANALFGRRMIQSAAELIEPRLSDGRQ